ncbi:hypothetical protein [Cyclobacterium sediminis]
MLHLWLLAVKKQFLAPLELSGAGNTESKGGKEARTSLANFNLLSAISAVLGTWYRRYQIIPKGERNAEERLGT